MSNAARHAHAARHEPDLQPHAGAMLLEISDDGIGFDPGPRAAGGGMRNLAQRARQLGAAVAVESAPGRGARIRLTLP